MNRVIVIAILTLILEFILDAFEGIFLVVNLIILSIFVFEFLVRYNYRRGRYLRTWGLRVDLPIIFIEFAVILIFFYEKAVPPTGINFQAGAIIIDHSSLHNTTGSEGWLGYVLDRLAGAKILRLLRFARIIKLIRDIADQPALYKEKLRILGAWTRAVYETLLIFLVTAILLLLITRIVTDDSPEKIVRAFVNNVLSRIRADQDTGIKNSDVLKAIYQVFTILSGMIVVAFFTQILLPIVSRIKATQKDEQSAQGRRHHVIIAIADKGSIGLIEEAIQVWALYEGREVVLLAPAILELPENLHPNYAPDIVRGDILSRGSWLAAHSEGADQIIILTTQEVDVNQLGTFLPRLSNEMLSHGLVVLVNESNLPYSTVIDQTGVRYSQVGLESLVTSIKGSIGDRLSVQSRLIDQLSKKFDKESSIFGNLDMGHFDETVEGDIRKILEEMPGKFKILMHEITGTLVVGSSSATEGEEGAAIRSLRNYLTTNNSKVSIILFVDSLHLIGVNGQLGADSTLRVVPIELLVMYAAYHESVCAGVLFAWLLPPNALQQSNGLYFVDPGFSRTTYRTRVEIAGGLEKQLPESSILGVARSSDDMLFRGYLTNSSDSIQFSPGDKLVVLTGSVAQSG
jgi:hypothetical protein